VREPIPFMTFEQVIDPIKLWHTTSQYASSPGNRADCYAELAIFSPVVAKPSCILIKLGGPD